MKYRLLEQSSLRRLIFSFVLLSIIVSYAPQSAQASQLEASAALPLSQTNPQQTVFLPLVAQDSGTHSVDLIAAAQARGEISSETALLYQVFAVFGDDRLPAKYRGTSSGPSDVEVSQLVREQYHTLSAQAKATLEPFLMPPYHSGSWWDLQQQKQRRTVAPQAEQPSEWRCGGLGEVDDPLFNEWSYLDSANGEVRIWWQKRYPQDAAMAKLYLEKVDAIWLKLHMLMGRQPPSDEGNSKLCRGGNNRYDISLVDLGANGETWPYEYTAGGPTPSYILLRRGAAYGTLIHELMHAFQFAFARKGTWSEYTWWAEATATWAVQYVDPTLNHEHGYADGFLKRPDMALEEVLGGDSGVAATHHYGAYLFPWFIQTRIGEGWIRTSWERFATEPNSLKVVNELIPGGFKQQWPDFTLRMLNRPPMDDFTKADRMIVQSTLQGDEVVALNGARERAYELDGNVKHLASQAYRFTFNDLSARSVTFVNPLFEQEQLTAEIRALVKINGKWAEEDWTDAPWRSFCRDVKAERVEELMIVISNNEWQNRNHKLHFTKPPRLIATNVACRGWDFTVTAKMTESGDTFNSQEETVTTGRWLRDILDGDDGMGRPFEHYQAKDVKATWKHTGTEGGCSGSGSGSVTLPGADQTWLTIWTTGLDLTGRTYVPGRRVYNGFGTDVEVWGNVTVPYNCGDDSFPRSLVTLGHWFRTETVPTQSVSADGKEIKGTFVEIETDEGYNRTLTYTWTMTALPPE